MPPSILYLHKPVGYEVTRPHVLNPKASSKTVYHLLPPEFHPQGWVPVGRLDKASTGLLLFVNKGPLVDLLQKPGSLEKVYEVEVEGPVEKHHAKSIMDGVLTPLGVLKAKSVELLATQGKTTWARVILEQGKNRQVRRLFGALRVTEQTRRLRVRALKRTRFGPLSLDIGSGEWRYLTDLECEALLGPARRYKEGRPEGTRK